MSQLSSVLTLSGLIPFKAYADRGFINVGERTNVTGSKRFAELIKNEKYEDALQVARQQVESGAQILDVNMDDALLDAEKAITKFLCLIQSEPDIASIPMMIDSSKFSVIQSGLSCVQGKCIVNSLSLKEGEEIFLHQASISKNYGAAVIVMAFDEQGQADNVERRIAIADRAYRLLTQEVGYRPEDIIFDLNVFAVATGIAEHNNYAVDFIEATQQAKKCFPSCTISGGVSNLSFSFRGNELVRQAMHSVFLYHAIQAGMGMGIVNAGQLPIYEQLNANLRECCEDVILNRSEHATDKLVSLAKELDQGTKSTQKKTEEKVWRKLPVSERLSHALIHGILDFIEKDVEELHTLHKVSPVVIIEKHLMAGLSIVGELFGEGKMFLPQVVKSARVMKRAVSYLEPYIKQEKTQSKARGGAKSILLATVKGDVHDIGKNIVGVVLGCNGYSIIDLGVMTLRQKIIDAAKEHNVDAIGLSGLITPSLDEMVDVAQEMQKQSFSIPLLIGGATTSRIHTALKIHPHYEGGVVHIQDASKTIPILSQLFGKETNINFLHEVRQDYEKIQHARSLRESSKAYLPLRDARQNSFSVSADYHPPKPSFVGVKPIKDVTIGMVRPYIDWTPFFITWEMKVKYPAILKDKRVGKEARQLLEDANHLLDLMEKGQWTTFQGVVGFWAAQRQGDDVHLSEVDKKIHFLRQQSVKASGKYNWCLSDFISEHHQDYIGAFAVTVGKQLSSKIAWYDSQKDDYQKIILQALGDRLVEAFAEYLHEQVRKKWWGYASDEQMQSEQLIKETYQGIRPAPGYPACPDHLEKHTLFDLLSVCKHTDIILTDSLAMSPASSVCGWYFSHPDSQYFGISQITDEQLIDYAKRKQISEADARKWLSPILQDRK